MKRAIAIGLACAVATVVPAASGIAGDGNGGDSSKRLAAKQCTAEKKADKAAFRAVHGKHAMRNCIRGTDAAIEDELSNASQECRAEREADPEGFQETWGTNAPKGEDSKGAKRNAFGKCVSSKVRAEISDDVEDFESAAQQCRAERSSDPEGFQETWGTNAPKGEKSKGAKRNAFGKCVSSKAKEAGAEEEPTDGEEQPTG